MMTKHGFRSAARPHTEARSTTHSPGNTTHPNKGHCRLDNELGAEWYEAMAEKVKATEPDRSKVLFEIAKILGEWQDRGGSVRNLLYGSNHEERMQHDKNEEANRESRRSKPCGVKSKKARVE